jgi:hypothetical protein
MEPEPRDSAASRRRAAVHAWRWPAVVIVVAALAAAVYFVTLERFVAASRLLAGAPGAAVAGLERLSRGLLTGDVTHRFLSAIPEVASPRAGNLELAVAEVVETIERTEERRALWDLVPLGSTTVGVRVPVVYRYHVPMAGEWRATVEGDRLTVVAPALRASLPPAFRTDRMERRVESGWLRFDGAERLAELERELTPMLAGRARDRRHLELAREPARRSLAEFARGWLMREGAAADPIRSLEVRFADEPAGAPRVDVLFSVHSERQ